MTTRQELNLHIRGDAPCLERDGAALNYTELLDRSSALLESMRSHRIQRALVRSDDPADVLRALDACNRAGVDLYVAHTTLDAEMVARLIERFSIQLTLGETDRLHTQPAESSGGEPHVFLMTSGTVTGQSKIATHSLRSIVGRLAGARLESAPGARWLLTYQPTGFAGMQVQLMAMLSGAVLVSTAHRTPHGMYEAARRSRVTHISGTPTFWRAFLMLAAPGELELRQITLGGEPVDQRTLARLSASFPAARVTHTYASTEAGFVYSVSDGREGFPREWLDDPGRAVQLRIRDDLLQVKSVHAMAGYASAHPQPLLDDGWLATADRCEVRGDRVCITGREDATVNVAGSKVYPATVETFLLSLPAVADAKVYGIPNPITGSILGADVVLAGNVDSSQAVDAISASCHARLARYSIPHVINIVDRIPVSASGKKS